MGHKHTVLCVDDERQILSSLKRLFRREPFNLLTTTNCADGLELLEKNEVHLVISDQRMPQMSGIEFLSKVKEKHPDTIRIVLSGYTEVDTIRDAINRGNIYKFILKPWNDDDLKNEISKCLEKYDLIRANHELNRTIIDKNRQLEHINKNLEKCITDRTRELELRNAALELTRALFEGIPAAVAGLGMDYTIILINRQAQSLDMGGKTLIVGKSIFDYFPEQINTRVKQNIDAGSKTVSIEHRIGGKRRAMTFSRMDGRYSGRGIILFVHPDPP